jgi:hypothetical protein
MEIIIKEHIAETEPLKTKRVLFIDACMKTEFKACLVNCAIAVVAAILYTLNTGNIGSLAPIAGIIFLVWGALSFFISLIIFISRNFEIARGVLLSAVLLVLVGYAVCSSIPFYSR